MIICTTLEETKKLTAQGWKLVGRQFHECCNIYCDEKFVGKWYLQ